MQVALAWLLHRSPNILLIPGTSSVEHLRENLSVVKLQLAPEIIEQLDSVASQRSRNSKEQTLSSGQRSNGGRSNGNGKEVP